LAVPMVLPIIWGLFFGKITQNAIWYSTGFSFIAALIVKFGIPENSQNPIIQFFEANRLELEIAVGVLVPLFILFFIESSRKKLAMGFVKLMSLTREIEKTATNTIATYPAKILAYS